MKCECGYEGIPTRHHEHPHGWKCPDCHAHRPHPLRHDPMRDDAGGDHVCSQCGMRGPTPEDLRTDCPGHGANWTQPILHCVCGEWAFAPKPPARTLVCGRCGVEYPEYLRADYKPPAGDVVDRAERVLRELRKLIDAAGTA